MTTFVFFITVPQQVIPKESPFDFALTPKKQAIIALVAIPIGIVLFWLPSVIGIFEMEAYFPWTISAAFTLLFAIFNSLMSLSAVDQNKYWGNSILAYAVVMIGGALMAWLFSGLSIYEAKSFSWLYIVFTFVYLLFLSMVRAMRKIVKIAQDQDARLRGERKDKRKN